MLKPERTEYALKLKPAIERGKPVQSCHLRDFEQPPAKLRNKKEERARWLFADTRQVVGLVELSLFTFENLTKPDNGGRASITE